MCLKIVHKIMYSTVYVIDFENFDSIKIITKWNSTYNSIDDQFWMQIFGDIVT